jgi:signal transduction histidine kinase
VAAAQKSLPLLVELAPGVPRRLIGDPTRLKQIVVNLLSNAVKFTQKGSVTLRAAQLALPESDAQEPLPRTTLCLEVTDTGIGIPPEKQAAMFEPFTQADDSTTRRFGGTGLGLSIVRRLVEMMGGHLELRSSPGQGSTFSVTLSLAVCSNGASGHGAALDASPPAMQDTEQQQPGSRKDRQPRGRPR